MDPNQCIPLEYAITLDYSKDNLQKLASFTSKVYARFPKLDNAEREAFRKNGGWMQKIDETQEKIPSPFECEQFEEALKNTIIAALDPKDKTASIGLSTDYYPEDILCDVAESVFLKNYYRLDRLFPYKTLTSISFRNNATQLRLIMDFKGGSF